MKVLQLVDSLEVGGTERVAVNIANALSRKIDTSLLCVTRKEGLLKEGINKDVEYLFLEKKKVFDIKAIKKLKAFIKLNNVNIIHAHSSSFFLAVLIKLTSFKVKVIWHDHYGNSDFIEQRDYKALNYASFFFSHVLSVNVMLEKWAKIKLKCKNVEYLPNFAIKTKDVPSTKLKGEEGKRIIHLANLRPQKDHVTLLRAFSNVVEMYPDWSLHCVGKNFKDTYCKSIITFSKANQLENNVFFYGSKPDVSNILSQSDIAVLSSKSEGLPIALLEYGFSKLPTIVTNVGDCDKVISTSEEGFLINKEDVLALKNGIIRYIDSKELRITSGINLFKKVNASFSENALIDRLLNIYKLHLK